MTGQLELEKIRACFEMCHKILTTDVRSPFLHSRQLTL